MLLGREVRHEMLIYRKLTHQNEMRKQKADAAMPIQAAKENLRERFFRTH